MGRTVVYQDTERILKFRAWDENEWVMYYSDDYSSYGEYLSISQFWEMVEKYGFPVDRFAGIYDKNGNEIYEGSLVISEQLDDLPDCDKWRWSDVGIATVHITPENGVTMRTPLGEVWAWDDEEAITHLRFLEVIGNVHEGKIIPIERPGEHTLESN